MGVREIVAMTTGSLAIQVATAAAAAQLQRARGLAPTLMSSLTSPCRPADNSNHTPQCRILPLFLPTLCIVSIASNRGGKRSWPTLRLPAQSI